MLLISIGMAVLACATANSDPTISLIAIVIAGVSLLVTLVNLLFQRADKKNRDFPQIALSMHSTGNADGSMNFSIRANYLEGEKTITLAVPVVVFKERGLVNYALPTDGLVQLNPENPTHLYDLGKVGFYKTDPPIAVSMTSLNGLTYQSISYPKEGLIMRWKMWKYRKGIKKRYRPH